MISNSKIVDRHTFPTGSAFDAAAGVGSSRAPPKALGLLSVTMLVIAGISSQMSASYGREILCVISFCQGCFGGIFRTGANWMMMRLHEEKVAPFIQTIHFSSGVGRFLAGLIASYFITRQEIPWAFLTGSLIIAAVAAPLGGIAVLSGTDKEEYSEDLAASIEEDASTSEESKDIGVVRPLENGEGLFIGLVALFVFILMGVQNSYQYLITAYAVASSPPLWYSSTADAALLSASYGFAFAASRLLAIPFSAHLDSLTILYMSTVLTTISLGCIVVGPGASSTLEWASFAIGAALAPAFPTSINYAKQTLGASMSGGQLSLLMFSGTMGGVFLPQIAGQFIRKDSDESLVSAGPEAMMQLLFGAMLLGMFVMSVAARAAPRPVHAKAG